MNLHQAVVMGRFCGLKTVEECMDNVSMHYNMWSYKEFPRLWGDLCKEYDLWKEGTLILDFDAIDKEVDADWKKYEEEEDKRNNQEYNEITAIDW